MGKIEIKRLKKSFEKTKVLREVNLEIKEGSFTIILGPSGCGKSTLLRLLSGLEHADSGEIWIDGNDVTNAEPKDRQVAMVFQNYALYPHMTVYKNVEYSLKIRKISKEIRHEMVMKALKIVELEDQVKKLPSQLSGGQRQRVALARAIVKDPAVFLMDEPLSNLDAKLRNQMRQSILELHKELGTTFVYVTHDQVEAMSMGDHIILLNNGEVVQEGSPKEMYTNPNHVFVASFIGTPPANIVKMPFGFIGIRPEEIKMEREEMKGEFIEVKAHVNTCELMGSEIIYNTSGKLGRLLVKAENTWDDSVKELRLYIPRDKVMYFDKDEVRTYDTTQMEVELLALLSK